MSNNNESYVYVVELFLGVSLFSFVMTLLLPKALKRYFQKSDRRKHKLSQRSQKQLDERNREVRRQNYVSLKNIDTFLDAKIATSHQNDELSPLECIENGFGYQSIFRTKRGGKNVRKERSRAARSQTMETKSPQDKKSGYEEFRFNSNRSVAQSHSSIFSLGSEYQDSRSEISPDSTFFSATDTPSSNSPNTQPKGSFEENKENKMIPPTRNENRLLVPLSERHDLNHANVVKENIGMEVTPKSEQNSIANSSRQSTKLEYTPSPLSLISKTHLREEGGFIVLIGGNVQGEENMRQVRIIELLHFKGVNYTVVDATDTNQSRRREDLIMLSGIRGHYPQIFLINDRGQASYLGNHETITQLERQGKLEPSLLCHHMDAETLSHILSEVKVGVDSSFFSV